MKGHAITHADQRRADLRVPFPKGFAHALKGHRIEHIGRRAKYILMTLDSGQTMILHLGMSGRILLIPAGQDYKPQKHDHLILECDDESKMVFNDARRFGMVMLVNDNEVDDLPAFKKLGPEPLDNHFSGPVLFEALKNKKTTIKAALMDQRVVAGLGNIYVSEALFYAGIHPERRAGSLKQVEVQKLVRAIRDVLGRAIEAGGSTLRDHRQASGELGYFQHQFAVYDRAGKACPGCVCDVSKTGGIEKMTQGGRATYFCSRKQK